MDWPIFFAASALGWALVFALRAPKTRAQDSKLSRVPDPADRADGTEKAPSEEMKEVASNGKKSQEESAATKSATSDGGRASENDRE